MLMMEDECRSGTKIPSLMGSCGLLEMLYDAALTWMLVKFHSTGMVFLWV